MCSNSAVYLILLIFFHADYYHVQDIKLFKYQLLQIDSKLVVVNFVAFHQVKNSDIILVTHN